MAEDGCRPQNDLSDRMLLVAANYERAAEKAMKDGKQELVVHYKAAAWENFELALLVAD